MFKITWCHLWTPQNIFCTGKKKLYEERSHESGSKCKRRYKIFFSDRGFIKRPISLAQGCQVLKNNKGQICPKVVSKRPKSQKRKRSDALFHNFNYFISCKPFQRRSYGNPDLASWHLIIETSLHLSLSLSILPHTPTFSLKHTLTLYPSLIHAHHYSLTLTTFRYGLKIETTTLHLIIPDNVFATIFPNILSVISDTIKQASKDWVSFNIDLKSFCSLFHSKINNLNFEKLKKNFEKDIKILAKIVSIILGL